MARYDSALWYQHLRDKNDLCAKEEKQDNLYEFETSLVTVSFRTVRGT